MDGGRPSGASRAGSAYEDPHEFLKDGEVDLGTSIMAVTFDGGVVFGEALAEAPAALLDLVSHAARVSLICVRLRI